MRRFTRRGFLRQAAVAASAASVASLESVATAREPGASTGKGNAAMEDALALLAKTGPEYHGGLANHGPMAAEALVALGRDGAVVPWVERYVKRLDTRPTGSRPIAKGEWKEALGQKARVADWITFFRREAEAHPWRELLSEWVPRLSPGIVAAAFHGVIRTGHAARSLSIVETPARRAELVDGLAYWAANHTPLPESKSGAAREKPSQAIRAVPHVPPADRVENGHITSRLAPVVRFPPFAPVADLVETSGDASGFLSDLTETFAGVFVASVPPGSLITFVHAVTGPSAVRLLLPHLDARARAEALRYAWQGAAAMYSGFGGLPPAEAARGTGPGRAELIERAITTGDEHAIKFTEACLREHALNPKPVYLQAASRAVERLA